MGEVLGVTEIKREQGYLYYTGTSDDGFVTVCRAKMGRGKKKKDQEE